MQNSLLLLLEGGHIGGNSHEHAFNWKVHLILFAKAPSTNAAG